jgi:DNA-binding MarR family transcriptional regulator
VEITEEGRALFARASVIADEVAARLLDCLSDQDQELLCSLLERFVAGSDD